MAKYYFTTKESKPLPNGKNWTKKNSIEVIADEYKEAAEYAKQTFGGFDGGYTESHTFSRISVYSVDISSKKALIELREKFAQVEAELDMLKNCLDMAENNLDESGSRQSAGVLAEIRRIKESFYAF